MLARAMEIFVTLNAVGGVLAFFGLRWGARKAAGKLLRRSGEERKPPDGP